MVEAICKRCQYVWEYKGSRNMWTTCPNCKTSVRIQMFVQQEKNKVKIAEADAQDQVDKYNKLYDFIRSRNPLLLEEYGEFLIQESKQKAKEEIKEVFDGQSKN